MYVGLAKENPSFCYRDKKEERVRQGKGEKEERREDPTACRASAGAG